MTRLDQDWVREPETQAVFDALEAGGHEAWFVGGCVRDAIIGRDVGDIDIATDAPPAEIEKSAEAAGLRTVPTGAEHGTITVISGRVPHEVTTFRRDVETDGRRAVVAFSKDMSDDAHRRDFTMNALYADRHGLVEDPLGKGLQDLSAGRIKFIDDPAARIREDYLRILRFFRFHATHGDPHLGLDPNALAAVAELSDGLATLPNERIGHEMIRLLAAGDPSPSVAAMSVTGVLQRVLSGSDHKALGPLVHCEAALELHPDAMRRLAVIGSENAKDAFRLSKTDARRLDRLRSMALTAQPASCLGYRLGVDEALGALAVRAALTEAPVPPNAREEASFGAEQVFPVSAEDLMPELQGAALGKTLTRLESVWIASEFEMDKAALLANC